MAGRQALYPRHEASSAEPNSKGMGTGVEPGEGVGAVVGAFAIVSDIALLR